MGLVANSGSGATPAVPVRTLPAGTTTIAAATEVITMNGHDEHDDLAPVYDANKKFAVNIGKACENADCISGDIMKGIKKPFQCSQFGKACTPENPLAIL